MNDQERIHAIMKELMDSCRIEGERRKAYKQRIAKAIWRDRTDVMDIMEATQAKPKEGSSASEAESEANEADEGGGWSA